MSDTPTVIEVDCTTGVQTERPMTADEIAAQQAAAAQAQADAEAKAAADKATADAKASAIAKLTALGLTADEVAALTA
jgi:dephospho-CoA kinase